MALNICGMCDSPDSHQGRANKGTLNKESGISIADPCLSLSFGRRADSRFVKEECLLFFFLIIKLKFLFF